MADGQVVFEISGDSRKVNQTIKEVTGNIQNESKKWDQAADKSAANIEASFSGMVKKIAAGISAAKIGQAILEWGKSAISAASDLAEVQNVVDVTFGDGAKQIESWAKTAGRQFGLTETQAKKFTSTLGAMMKSAGMSGDEIVGMSTDLAGLAADMASFYNLDFETAFQKIRSGISGETEPLKQLGVNMSVANMEAFALEQGITKSFNAMSQSEQTMLRYQYLMKATADAQGDFARTSDGFANATRRVETALETIQTKGGSLLLTVIEPLTSGLATFLEQVTATPEETLLDKVAAIDVDADAKIANIKKVAEEAQGLIDQLGLISGTDAGEAIQKMATGANKLDASSPATWKALAGALTNVNGLQNIFGSSSAAGNIEALAGALSGAEVDTDKAEAWKTFLGALSENAEALTSLTGTSVEETKAWLEGLAEAVNSIDAGDAEAWNKLLTTLVSGFATDTPEGQKFIEGLASQFLAMGSDSETAANGLQALGFSSDQISDKQKEWLRVCKQLVETIPGLSSVINTETGEVTGGIGALERYVDEWKTSQEKLIYWKAFYAKKAALQETQNNLYSLEIEAGGAKVAAERARKAFEEQFGDISQSQRDQWFGDLAMDRPLSGRAKEYTDAWLKLAEVEATATEKADKYNTAAEQSAQVVQDLADQETFLTEKYGELEEAELEAGEAAQDFGGKSTEAWKTATSNAQEAIKALADYVKSVHDATEQSVNGIIKGFDQITKAGDESRRKSSEYASKETELMKQYQSSLKGYLNADGTVNLKKMSDNYDKLSKSEKEAYNALAELHNKQVEVNKSLEAYKPETMAANLQSQIDFMNEYLTNLQTAREMGLSDELLASLSDGSAESAEYLAGLVKDASGAKKVDELYQQVQEKKKGFTDALTEQKLTVDETYQAMVDKAKEAIGEMSLGEEAAGAMGETVSGLATGISEHVSEVSTAVDSILAELNRLNNYGISIDLGTFGAINISLPGFSLNGSHALGLDYVPFNGYLAELHEGEGILTAEENRIWQRFKNGGAASQNVDYEALGGVMRDNVKPGGDVFLDGRVVGSVISKQQANSYRSLQRSGWQS